MSGQSLDTKDSITGPAYQSGWSLGPCQHYYGIKVYYSKRFKLITRLSQNLLVFHRSLELSGYLPGFKGWSFRLWIVAKTVSTSCTPGVLDSALLTPGGGSDG